MQQISEDEVLLCFLRAELDSPTEGPLLVAALERGDLGLDVLTAPDLEDPDEGRARRDLFDAYRGAERVFEGLPWADLTWHEGTLTEANLRTRTFSCRNHFESRYGTTRIERIAALWDREEPAVPNAVTDRSRRGDSLEPPILIAEPSLERLVVLEGHNRLISYLRDPAGVAFPLRALLGVSPDSSQWSQW